MKIKPVFDKVICKLLDAEPQENGLYVPDTLLDKKVRYAEVVEVGPGKRDDNGNNIPIVVKKGDRIMLNKFGGTEFTMDDKPEEKYIVISETEVIGIVE